MTAKALARAILEIVPSASRSHREDPVIVEGEWRELPVETPSLGPIRDEVSHLVRELDEVLRDAKWRLDSGSFSPPDGGYWTLGSVEQRAPLREIHRGYLEPIRRFAVVAGIPDRVVAFLARIPGWNDYVKRENHPGVGWHYHYLPDPAMRSDVLLAWDTRWQASAVSLADWPVPLQPFFGEKHAEGKADVRARPWLWGDKKKQSMYGVCAPDLQRWKIHEFRCASSHAEPVWPPGATVTPMVALASPAAKKEGKSSRHR